MARTHVLLLLSLVTGCAKSSAPTTTTETPAAGGAHAAPCCYYPARAAPAPSSDPSSAPPSAPPSTAGSLDLGALLSPPDARSSLTASQPSLDVAAASRKSLEPVTEIRIDKSDHRLELRAGRDLVRSYTVAIGPGGIGPKQWEGDMTTPVGTYRVTGRFKGSFHQFLGVSYPNAEDLRRYAMLKAEGKVPDGRGVGNAIGIHGGGSGSDWTAGCVALDNHEIDEIGRLVRDGTRIVITE